MIHELGSPRALDTFLQDGMLWPISYRSGQAGYIKDNYHFVPLDKDRLVKVKETRGGSVTWTLDGTRNTTPVQTQGKDYEVTICYHGGANVQRIVRKATSTDDARSRAIKWFAASNKLTYATVFAYFKTHSQAISVKEL